MLKTAKQVKKQKPQFITLNLKKRGALFLLKVLAEHTLFL
jgi:hypothetical protein